MRSIAEEAKRAAQEPARKAASAAAARVREATIRNCPELVERIPEFKRHWKLRGMGCAGAVWGKVDPEDVEWLEGA